MGDGKQQVEKFEIKRIRPTEGKPFVIEGHSLRAAASAAAQCISHIDHTVTWERLIDLEPGCSIAVDMPITSTGYQFTRINTDRACVRT